MTSAEKWFRPVTLDDWKESDIHRETPRKRIGRDGIVSSKAHVNDRYAGNEGLLQLELQPAEFRW